MDTNQAERQPVVITPEYLASLSHVELTDLLLHNGKLFMSAMTAQLKDKDYLQSIEMDIKAIHEEIKKRG